VPEKVEKINDYLYIDTYKSNKIKIGMNEMTVRLVVGWLLITARQHRKENLCQLRGRETGSVG